jgi:putative membrane protein
MIEALIRGIHLIAVLAVFVGMLIVLPSASTPVDRESGSQLLKIYYLKLAALLVAALAGLILWLAIGKPASFYTDNPVFHVKLGVFAFLALALTAETLSVRRFLGQATEPARLPAWLGIVQKVMLLLFLVVLPLAYLMARGIGYPG